MKKFILLIILFTPSCLTNSLNNTDISFSENMTFEEFKNKLNDYDKVSSYPNINN
tara:strand:- start:55 stop:219 length:165 start_codon:yes stop_codon:yes gene_type:complete